MLIRLLLNRSKPDIDAPLSRLDCAISVGLEGPRIDTGNGGRFYTSSLDKCIATNSIMQTVFLVACEFGRGNLRERAANNNAVYTACAAIPRQDADIDRSPASIQTIQNDGVAKGFHKTQSRDLCIGSPAYPPAATNRLQGAASSCSHAGDSMRGCTASTDKPVHHAVQLVQHRRAISSTRDMTQCR